MSNLTPKRGLTRDEVKTLFREVIAEGGFDLKEYVHEQMKAHKAEFDENLEQQRTNWMQQIQRAREAQTDEGKEKGLTAGRLIKCLVNAQGNAREALALAKEHYGEGARVVKALSAGEAISGGFLLAPEFASEVIELLRPASVVRSLNPVVLPMEQGVLTMPRITGGATAAYTGENQNIASSQPSTGQLELVWKKLAALVPISNDLMRFSNVSADAVVRDDLVRAMATREDQAFIRDDGTSNTPRGLRFAAAAANVAAFTAGAGPAVAAVTTDLGSMVLDLLNADVRMIRPGWIMAPRTAQFLMTQRDANDNYVWRPEMLAGNLWGWPFKVTTNVPINLAAPVGDSSEIYLADFADVVIGEASDLVVDASPNAAYFDSASAAVVSAYSRDQSVVRAIARHDIGLRHDASVSIRNGVQATP